MSALYNVEPQPTAKVLLKTTSGDIELELFAKQTPLASRNFLQHCLDGYYDNTLFFRLVPGFILQGGDPTGLGTGGESALEGGAPFADEFHSRLRFNRRGLLGMANSGEKDDNTSQFFLTLDKTPELEGKNTMFGRVEGDTIYNLMKMGEAELAEDGSERPLYPSRVLSAEILVNPFSDMVKRTQIEVRTKPDEKKTKKKRKTGKNMLSFGGDEGDDDAPIIKKAKVNPTVRPTDPAPVSEPKPKPAPRAGAEPPRPARRRSTSSPSTSPEPRTVAAPPPPPKKQPSRSPSPSPERPKPLSALERTNAEIAALKASMKRGATASATDKQEKPKSALEAMISATATRGRKRGRPGAADEKKALDMFNAFKARLGATAAEAEDSPPEGRGDAGGGGEGAANGEAEADGAEETLCDLHFIAQCQSCRAWDEETGEGKEPEVEDENWMAHRLSFAKDGLGKDLEWKRKMEELEEVDTRTAGGWSGGRDVRKDRERREGDGRRERRDRDGHHGQRNGRTEERRKR